MLAAVEGPYRAGMKTVEGACGRPVVSHKTGRRRGTWTGEAMEADEGRKQDETQDWRKVPAIFLETDGLHTSVQRPGGFWRCMRDGRKGGRKRRVPADGATPRGDG